ncbi:MAG: hypothetical protein K6F94_08810 [Bacteroidaceae bacterium]|nr:hypothetical protein [Bacteroidaceae bacterium]
MKKLFFILTALLCLSACNQSKEAKADKLIRKALNAKIINIETYEPVETVFDSVLVPIDSMAGLYEFLSHMPPIVKKYNEYTDAMQKAMLKKSIYEDDISSFSRRQYNEAIEELADATNNVLLLQEKMTRMGDKFKGLKDAEKKFDGYIVTHTYRYVNKEGQKTIGKQLYVMNKDLTEIKMTLDLEDEELKDFLEELSEQLYFEDNE